MTATFVPRADDRGALDDGDDDGFTLLELLVGLILLSLITVLMTQSLNTGRAALASVERQQSEVTVEAVQRYLRRAIAQMRAIRLPAARSDSPLIEAESNRLQMVTDYVPAGQYGGLYSIALELQPAGRAGLWDLIEVRTLLRPSPQPGAAEPARPQARSRLLRDVIGVKLSYFGVRDEQQGAQWGTDWLDSAQLPRLVAVDVAFPHGDRRQWPPLVIAPASGQ